MPAPQLTPTGKGLAMTPTGLFVGRAGPGAHARPMIVDAIPYFGFA